MSGVQCIHEGTFSTYVVALVIPVSVFVLFQYKMKESELKLVKLSVSVWDMNWFGKKRFLSEVSLPLSALDLTNATNHWYSLEHKVHMTKYHYSKFHLIM